VVPCRRAQGLTERLRARLRDRFPRWISEWAIVAMIVSLALLLVSEVRDLRLHSKVGRNVAHGH